MKTAAVAILLAVASMVPPAIAHADCGDPGQDPCTGPVPTVDQVVAIMAELTDPNKPSADKTDIVTPGFNPHQAHVVDSLLHAMDNFPFHDLPLNFIVTDIQSAPANLAGATVTTRGWIGQNSGPMPIVLGEQGGHWLITNDSAIQAMNAFWYEAARPRK
jgi:hypothetical protein